MFVQVIRGKIIMAALRSRFGHYIFILWFLLSFCLSSSAKLCGEVQGMELRNYFRRGRHLYSDGRPSRWACIGPHSSQNCSVLCCALLCTTVVHNDTHTHKAVLTADCWLFSFRLSFRVFVYRSNVLCVFCFSLDCFVLVLFAFVVLGLVSSVLRQEI